MSDAALRDACTLAASIREGDLSAREAVDQVLARIARQAAREPLGPLHGVPFSVKDLIDTAGLETAFGSYLMAGNIPLRDAATVARLKAAGAITKQTSMARNARTIAMPRPPIPMPGSTARAKARRRSFASSVMG